MANSASPKRAISGRLRKLLENLLSQMTWLDLLVGLGAVVAISFLVLGFGYRTIPDFKVGDIAGQDVRVLQDLVYEDTIATTTKREAAKTSVPAIYDLDTKSISTREAEVRKAFESARQFLAEKQIPPRGRISLTEEKEIVSSLAETTGDLVPEDILPILLRHRFNPTLEAQIVRLLDTVLRGGIVSDKSQFLRDQKAGVVLRDVSTKSEQQLSDAYTVRDLVGARDYLRQSHLEYSNASAGDRRALAAFLETLLVPTLIFNATETRVRRETAAGQVAPVEVQIKKGRTIIRSGDEITQEMVSQLAALRNLSRPGSLPKQFLGFFLIVVTLVYALWRYLVHDESAHRKIRNDCLLSLVIIILVLGVARVMTGLAVILSDRVFMLEDPTHLYYAIPFASGAILATLLMDTTLGIVVSLILATLSGLFYGDIYAGVYVIVGSLAGIHSIRQYKDRAAILKAGLTIGVVNTLGILAIDLLRQVPLVESLSLFKIFLALSSGILTSVLASILLPALESLFKITTDIRLLELSNLNAPILRRLSVEAPGTYHHSLMVGTLAEAAAEAIGANSLLVRVGAYYHDLGKMLKPDYFVENQAFGMNKHETLSPSMSSLIISNHVKDGLELAKEIGLAERIRDMIPQHHGTRVMTYFYQKAKDSIGAKNQEVVETDFRYPGPKPQTKEAAIMMMADSVEAASRTLSNPTSTQIQGMINRLVDAIVADNQFDECDITLREIRLIKESFFKVLSGIHHRRIDYPGYDFKKMGEEPAISSVQSAGPKQAKAI